MTSLVISGGVLAVVLHAWLTVSVTGAVVVALVTVALEYLLEPVVDGYVAKQPRLETRLLPSARRAPGGGGGPD